MPLPKDILSLFRRLLGGKPGALRAASRTRLSRAKAAHRAGYLAERDRARAFVHEKLRYWNAKYGFQYTRVAIRDQRTRWGSASGKGNLNFNYRVAKLPEHLADYVIVHELCHLKHLDHSRDFWSAVEREIPDHQKRRAELRRVRMSTPSKILHATKNRPQDVGPAVF